MDRLIWTAVTGMNASMARERMIASNMANAQTPGFRAEVMAQTPMTLEGPSLEVRSMNDSSVYGAQMDAGALVETGRPLDLALQGDALLSVQASDGTEAYTRRGDISISPAGLLVNGEGVPVLGDSGPISVPPDGAVAIGQDGAVLVRDKAQPEAPPQQIGRIKLASWRGSRIEKGLDGLFRVYGGGVLPQDLEARVIPGALEQSNVKPSQVLIEMVEAQRLYDIRTKLVATAKELDEGGASLMRLG
ncbi:flagellar basal body rod protein FlgF [Novosphingobium sp.]|uniref:flagellar basal body rod protein FlgF n=1 Tax=Novosphingobium sp. TaxID=1874826 RepID=UPI0025DEB150|nr:flagellar basal body rod protein FlgF [Novosphingobium sp.]MCC6924592.1 flagellar basal body rod protein FlgF [Novosphingobium sp.]